MKRTLSKPFSQAPERPSWHVIDAASQQNFSHSFNFWQQFQAPGTKFYALIFEAAGAMTILPPVVIPEPSEWVVSIDYGTHTPWIFV